MQRIAVEYLELEKHEVDLARANAKSVEDYHFDCLIKWKHKMGPQGTGKALYERIQKASQAGLIDRSKLRFLVEQVLSLLLVES